MTKQHTPGEIPDVWIGLDSEGADVTVPGRYEVCSTCKGTGRSLPLSMQGHAYTESDFEEDPDLRDQLVGGHYDVTCTTCKGERVTIGPDFHQMTESQKHLQYRTQRDRDHVDAISRSEMLNGA